MKILTRHTAAALFIAATAFSCTVSQRLQHSRAAASLSQMTRAERQQQKEEDFRCAMKIEHRGDSVYLVETDTLKGERIMTMKARTVSVTGNVRNIPERNGRIQIDFKVVVPKVILGGEREILLTPVLHFASPMQPSVADSMTFPPICIRGTGIDMLQWRERWQTDMFIRRFAADSLSACSRFIRFPLQAGAMLDSVVEKRSDIVYYYHSEVESQKVSRRMSLTIPGTVSAMDGSRYRIPPRDTIGFIMSSMLTFTDTTTKYRIRVVDRYQGVALRTRIIFPEGKSELIDSLRDNHDEIGRIRELQKAVLETEDEYIVDSLSVTAAASPEGTYRTNDRLSAARAQAVADSLFQNELESGLLKIHHIAENWNELRDSVAASDFTCKTALLALFDQKDPDRREMLIRTRYPHYYHIMRRDFYPTLRSVTVRYSLRRRGQEKDTVHLHEIDTVYVNAMKDLQQRRYFNALQVLREYRDRNTAIAMLSLGYDKEAKEIMEAEPLSDTREYLLAILCSRLQLREEGRQHYLNACRLNPRMEFRGNLDPEINRLLK